jgi:HlyD family secretion protein
MKAKKILIIIGIAIALIAIVGFTVNQTQKNVVTVQTGKVMRQDISSIVTASGEIKPLTYVNVGANAGGRIIHLLVKEGDKVKKGQLLAQLENIQSAATVEGMRASFSSSQTDALAQEAALKTAVAQQESSKASLTQAKIEFDRAAALYKEQLTSKADFDTKKANYEVQQAVNAQDQARVAQARAQVDSAHGRVSTAKAQLTGASDVLNKTNYPAPFDGVITNLPVHEGEAVVPGIQNALGSVLMTVADMSVITAEVRVDETDIVNVKLGQPSEVTIDAIPGKTFKGKVTQIGDNAIIRSTGLSTSQSTASSQEAKDFKVVITLENPPDKLRPGLSATAKITTGSEHSVLAIPIQALTVRNKSDLEAQNDKAKGKPAPSPTPGSQAKKEDQDIQGVFVINKSKKAEFRTVETGLTGTTEIQIKTGLQEGDEIITGSYKVLRTLRNGAGVKVDNSVATKGES